MSISPGVPDPPIEGPVVRLADAFAREHSLVAEHPEPARSPALLPGPEEPLAHHRTLLADEPAPWSLVGHPPGLLDLGDPLGPTDDGPTGYTRPDALVLDDVAKALAFDPLVEAAGLTISCEEGRVAVGGRVSLVSARQRVESLLASVFGVSEIDLDDLAVGKDVEPLPDATNEQEADDGD